MKATIYDPDLGAYEVDVPDDDPSAIAEIEQFTRENTRLTRNAERRERYHHCWAYTPRKPELKETRVPQCSSQHYL